MKEQLTDEDKAGELYETAKKLLEEEGWDIIDFIVKNKEMPNLYRDPKAYVGLKQVPVQTDYAALEKVASDERSHKILLRVLTERLCP